MTIHFPPLNNTPSPTVTYGKRHVMTQIEIFNEHYRCTIEPTDRRSFKQMAGIVQVGATPMPTYGPPQATSEKVFAIYVTESMLEELIKDNVDRIKEGQMIQKDPQLYKLYMEYKLWLELKK